MTDLEFTNWLKQSDSIRLLLVEVTARVSGVETVLRLSNRPYTTALTDLPANTQYIPCIVGGVDQSEELSLDGSASISFGAVEIGNRAGERDAWLDYVWVNRSIKIYMGDPRWAKADFRLIFDGVVANLDRASENLSLVMLDKLARLNNPISEQTLGGSTENADKFVPLLFGECHNVTPLLVSAATLTYQVHAGSVESIEEVRNNGVPVDFTPNNSAGTFTLSVNPAGGTITASVRGANTGGYSNKISDIIYRIVTGYGPAATRLTDADIDLANFASFLADNSQPVGYYCADRTNVLEVCQALAYSVGASVVFSAEGKLRLVKLALGVSGGVTVTPEDMYSDSLSIASRPAVKASCRLGFCKNWTIQDTVAAGIPPANADMFTTDFLYVTSSDATTATVYKLNTQPPAEETYLLTYSDANVEAARRLYLWKDPRTVFEAKYFEQLLLTNLGDSITIKHPRYGLSAGKSGTVISIQRDWIGGSISLGILV